MMMRLNSQSRIYVEGYVYFVTMNVQDRLEFFEYDVFCELFVEELKLCKRMKEFELYGFCILPDHVHLLLKPGEKFNISQVIKSLKENFSRDANYIIKSYIPASDTSTCRLRMREFIKQHIVYKIDLPKFKWQKSFHDHIVRDERDFENHYSYTVNNYIKHGLNENYQYTSLNFQDIIDL